MVKLNLDVADCANAAVLIEQYFFQNIRDDPEIDNLNYVRSLLAAHDELTAAAAGERRCDDASGRTD